MAAVPNYEGPQVSGVVVLDNASGTSLSSAVLTGATNGTKVKEIRVHSAGTVSPGTSKKLAIYKIKSSTAVMVDIISLTDTLNIRQAVLKYDNLTLQVGDELKFLMTSALASSSALHIDVEGRDV